MPSRAVVAPALAALALLLPRAALAGPALPPMPDRLAPMVRAVPMTARVVALTFDDGPSPRYTQAILDALRQDHARATFFVVGQEAVRLPALVRAEAKAGMEVANHGMHHRILRGRTASEVESEANEGADVIRTLTGRRPHLYRLPQGVGDTTALQVLGRLGYVVIAWSVDTRDYLRQSPGALVTRALGQVAPGRIIIFHDGGGNRQATVEAVRILLPRLRAEGYTVTTVSDLLGRAGYRAPGAPAQIAAEDLRRSI